ncbi:MAG: hypothetical protein M5U34_00645 [Chloroflexi bacterium]|nr:hypothetical protein [Chloroflexota bacterium]
MFAIFPGVDNSSTAGILIMCVGGPILTGILLGVLAVGIESLWNRMQFPSEKKEMMMALYHKSSKKNMSKSHSLVGKKP